MSSTTDIAASDEMIWAKFNAASISHVVCQPSLTSIRSLVNELAKIVAGCKTSKWGGKHGHLKVVLGQTKYRPVLAQPDLDCTVVAKPAVASTDFKAGEDANAVERKNEVHKVLWREYQMQEAVNEFGVEKLSKQSMPSMLSSWKRSTSATPALPFLQCSRTSARGIKSPTLSN